MLEETASFDEEGTLLLVEGLEGGKIEHGRIRFHLAEVGLDRRVQGEVGRDAVLEVGPHVFELVQLLVSHL